MLFKVVSCGNKCEWFLERSRHANQPSSLPEFAGHVVGRTRTKGELTFEVANGLGAPFSLLVPPPIPNADELGTLLSERYARFIFAVFWGAPCCSPYPSRRRCVKGLKAYLPIPHRSNCRGREGVEPPLRSLGG